MENSQQFWDRPPSATLAPDRQRSHKGPLSDMEITQNVRLTADAILKQFTEKAPDATLSWGNWILLKGIIEMNIAGVMGGLQHHLVACGMAWQATLAPEDQAVLRDVVNGQIALLSQHTPEDHDRIGKLLALRDKLAVGIGPYPDESAAVNQ